MKVSKSFLSDYVDIKNIDYKELAEKMLKVGNEYESIHKISDASNITVGLVLECIKHPNSDHLHICKVDIKDKILQIICGAPNVKEGIKVLIAKEGAILPNNIKIKNVEIAGYESCGMICSLNELGIETKYLTEEDKKGIHILDENAELGIDGIKYMGYDDEIIDFELTSNRGDLLSILGMAHEVATIYNLEVKYPQIEFKENGNINDYHSLKVETDDCSLYLGKRVNNVIIKESPEFIKLRLIASGIRPINNVVDISNYVMLEYGQPLHFFDADKLGNKILVRNASQNEEIKTLDGIDRRLKETDVVITDGNKPVALAGVMGGYDTEIENYTKNIFIESAIFNPYSVRKTAQTVLRSESSNRYEKGIDPNRTLEAINRACQLLNIYASGEVVGGFLIHDIALKNDKEILVSFDKINRVLGMSLTKDEVISIIKKLGFKYEIQENNLLVKVPTRRLDVNIKEDLIEEIGRIYGYDNIKSSLPVGYYKQGTRNKKAIFINTIKEQLLNQGLNEVITYSLISNEESNMFINENYDKIIISNPMNDNRKVLRNSLIPSLLTVFNYNIAHNIKDILIFEIGTKFSMDSIPKEEKIVSGLLYGTYLSNHHLNEKITVDFYLLKGIMENLLNYLGYKNRYVFIKDNLKDVHPGMTATILIDNQKIGYIGRINPNISKKDVYVFELNIEKIMLVPTRTLKFKEISKYPEISKDLAFIVDRNIEANEIIKIIKATGGRILTNIDVFDVYTGENIEKNKKSVAFTLTFQDENKTLTDIEVMEIFNKIIDSVTTKLNAELRDS